jgi:cytidine deaminase
MSMSITREELLALARTAALRAHAPYSRFRVGAALVANGQIYCGVNVELASYGLTLCAERAALAAALTAGAREITQIAVACIDAPATAPAGARTPCGACRQWLAELAPTAEIYIDGLEETFSPSALLPYAFVL